MTAELQKGARTRDDSGLYYLIKRAHKDNTKTFEELNYAEQAKSINAMILNIEKAVKAHLHRAESEGKDVNSTKENFIAILRKYD